MEACLRYFRKTKWQQCVYMEFKAVITILTHIRIIVMFDHEKDTTIINYPVKLMVEG